MQEGVVGIERPDAGVELKYGAVAARRQIDGRPELKLGSRLFHDMAGPRAVEQHCLAAVTRRVRIPKSRGTP